MLRILLQEQLRVLLESNSISIVVTVSITVVFRSVIGASSITTPGTVSVFRSIRSSCIYDFLINWTQSEWPVDSHLQLVHMLPAVYNTLPLTKYSLLIPCSRRVHQAAMNPRARAKETALTPRELLQAY